MAVAEELQILIRAEVDAAIKELKKVERQTKGVKDQYDKLTKFFKNTLGIGVAIAAFNKLSKAVGETVDAFQQQEQAERRLAQAVENNPLLTGDSADRIQRFASELQEVTTVGDETAISLASMAAASGRTENEIMGMVEAAADVSAAMGITMDSAMKSLNKSFGGMTGELGELVPELQNLTKEQLEAGGAVDLIRQKFDGAAEAIGDTATGSIQQFRNSIGDLKEVIGGLIANALTPLISKAQEVVGAISGVIQKWQDLRNVQRGATEDMSLGDQISAQRTLVEQARERLQRAEERVNKLEGAGMMQARQVAIARNELDAARELVRQRTNELSRLETKAEILGRYSQANEEHVEQQRRQERIQELILQRENQRELTAQKVADIQEDYNKGLITQEERQERLKNTYENFLEVARSVLDNFEGMGESAPKTEDTIRGILAAMEALEESSANSAENFEKIAEQSQGISTAGQEAFNRSASLSGYQAPGASAAGRAARTPSPAGGGGGGGASAIAAAAGGAIAGAASSLVSGMLNVVTKFVDIFKQAIVGSEAVKEVMDNLKSGIADALAPAAKALANAIRPLVPTIVSFASGVGQLLIPIFQGIGVLLQTALMPILQAMLPVMAQLGEIVRSVFVPVWQRLGGLLAGQMIPVFEILGSLIQFLNPVLQVWGALMHMFSGVMQSLIPVLEAVSWIFDKLSDVVRFLWNNALMPFGNFMLDLARNIAEGFDDIVNGIITAINKVPGVDIGGVNISGRVPGNLDRIEDDGGRGGGTPTPELNVDNPPTPTGGGGGGGTGRTRQGRVINIGPINIYSEVIAGEEGIRDVAIMIRDEIRAAEALGV